MRKLIALAAGVIILALANYSIYSREKLLSDGGIVLLRLAPVDPRSLMQGDFMALRFEVANSMGASNLNPLPDGGHVVLARDEKQVGSFTRIDDGKPMAANEMRMRYRLRNGQVKFATNAFFFQEGTAALYEKARYGEFRVDGKGDSILTGLRDEELGPLGQPRR